LTLASPGRSGLTVQPGLEISPGARSALFPLTPVPVLVPLSWGRAALPDPHREAGKGNLPGITESQNGRGWKGPLWVI